MPVDIKTLIETIDFRVLIEPAEDGMYVATCLETGAVAEGATIEEAEGLIKAILENDFKRAIQAGSVEWLLAHPASFDERIAWYEMKAKDPDAVRHIPLAVGIGPNRRDAQSEVRISTGTRKTSVA